MKSARSKACGCPGSGKFGPEIRMSLLAKKVAMGVKKGKSDGAKIAAPYPKA